jgi:KDO2-lipid IV(A) lauroyltransferase
MADPTHFDEELNLGSRGGVLAYAEYLLTRVALGGAARLPRPAQNALFSALARVAARFDRRHTAAARSYLAEALGPEAARDDGRILRAYRHLFRLSVDAEAFDRRVPQERLLEHVEVEASDEVLAAMRSGRGGIMVTSHVGDWEAGSAVLPHLGMKPTYVIARPPRNRFLSRHLLRVRERRQVVVMPRRGGMRQAASILEAGGWIAMLLDQRPKGKHTLAPFFGRLAPCERGAAVLMKRLDTQLIFGACYLTERPFHYRLVFPRLVSAEELSALSLEQVVALVNGEMEQLILRHPEQYFWLHDRYRDAPPEGAGSLAAAPAGAEASQGPSPGSSGR